MKPRTINWAMSETELERISKIVKRYEEILKAKLSSRELIGFQMDVSACHCNGCPLDLEELLVAEPFELAHDVAGIHRHLDRKTGKLLDHFLPRYARKQ